MRLHRMFFLALLTFSLTLIFAAPAGVAQDTQFKSREIGVITTLAGGGRPPFVARGRALETTIEGASGLAVDRNGNMYVAGFLAHRVFKVDRRGAITVLAGTGEPATSGDGGPAAEAALNGPSAVAVDGDIVYIAEQLGDRIRRVDAAGVITTFGGGGTRGTPVQDGSRALGVALEQPAGLAIRNGEVYFTEFAGNFVRRVDKEGRVFRVAGTGERTSGGDGGPALRATLQGPAGITFDARGRVYVSEVFSGRIRVINERGVINTVAGLGKPGARFEGRNARTANLRMPHGLAVDRRGNLYVADFAANRIFVINQRNVIRTFAGTGQGDLPRSGRRTAIGFESPLGLTVDAQGNLLTATYNQGAVLNIHPTGRTTHVVGQSPRVRTEFASAREAFFKNVGGVAADKKGNIFVTEVYGNRVWHVTPNNAMRIFAGSGIARSTGDKRTAARAEVNHPVGVVPVENGTLIIEADGHRIRFVDNAGTIHTAVGIGRPAFSGDGGIAAGAGCAHPHYGDTFGAYSYPADSIAGVVGNSFETTPATSFAKQSHAPAGSAFQRRPFFVFVDTDNHRVRKVDDRGIITTVAGNGSARTSGDGGPAVRAGLNRPEDVVVDSEGNLYISEAHRVRKVDTRGIITTYAGTGRRGFSGDGGPATRADLDSPFGLALDGKVLYIADSWNNVVWKVDENGIISLFAGTREKRSTGDGGPATKASLNAPIDLAVQQTPEGTYLLIAELEGARVRAIRIR